MATDCKLSRTQKNEILEGIQAHELDPSEFRWEEEETPGGNSMYIPDSGVVSRLVHDPTNSYCLYDMRENFYYVTFAPGRNKPYERIDVEDWNGFRGYALIWLSCLQIQYEAPDLWATYVGVKQLTSAIDSSTQDKLSDSEQEDVKKGLEQIRTHLLELVEGSDKKQEQQKYIHNQVDYLVDAAKHQTRKDLGNIVLGTLMGTAVQLAITSEQFNGLLSLAGSCLGSLFSGQPPQLQ